MAWTAGLYAQPLQHFETDYFTVKAPFPGETYLNYTLSLNNENITFERKNSGFEAQIDAWMYVFDSLNVLCREEHIDKTLDYKQFDKTIDSGIQNFFNLRAALSPGHYTVKLVLEDKVSGKRKTHRQKVSVPNYHGGFHLSSIRLFHTRSTSKNTQYPNLDHIYYFTEPVMSLYYEAYLPTPRERVEVTYSLIRDNRTIFSKKEWVDINSEIPGFKTSFSTRSLPPGRYTLRVTQNTGSESAQTENYFEVVQSPIDLRYKTYSRALSEMRFALSRAEYDSLAHIPANRWQQALNDFWRAKDPAGTDIYNSVMLEYYRRIRNANKWFGKGHKEGWQSDLGMVYILLGKPDAVVKMAGAGPFDGGRQIWEYHKLGLTFVFISQSTFADYNLVNRQDFLFLAENNY